MLKTKHALSPGRPDRLRPVPPPVNRITPTLSRSLWYGLHFPQLSGRHSPDQQEIQQLAALCLQVSDYIVIASEDALALEVRSSLKYFGGISRIRQVTQIALKPLLQQWQLPDTYHDAASPSASASIVLARSAINRLVPDPENLRSALGTVAIANLALDARLRHRLEKCGLFYLRDLWRLPSAALRIRFGRALSDYLEQLLALRPTTLSRWQLPPSFCETLTPDVRAESHQDILLLAAELLTRMQIFLQKNHLSTDHILLKLCDETVAFETIRLGTRRPIRDKAAWLLLLENRINEIKIEQGVSSLTLIALDLHDYHPSGANPQERGISRTQVPGGGLLEILCSRLGTQSVFCLNHQQDYDPVAAGKYLAYPGDPKYSVNENHYDINGFGLRAQQPCWLLQSPLPLKMWHESPFYLSPLIILRGPERIETHWWSGKNIKRDYYIASNHQGMMLWVYRDIGKRSWFLQGLFA